MELSPKVLYSRKEAAALFSVSVASLDMMVSQGMLKISRKGRRVLVHRNEIERVARQDIPRIWPPKPGKGASHEL